MRTIKVTRKKKLASAMMPYWIIVSGLSKKEFMEQNHLEKDLCDTNITGFPIPRIHPMLVQTMGVRIENGQTVEIPIDDDVKSIFACTNEGSLSNEIPIENISSDELILSTKGGFKTTSYPYFELEKTPA